MAGPVRNNETTPLGQTRRVAQKSPPPETAASQPLDAYNAGKASRYRGLVDLAERTKNPGTMWWGDRPLSDAKNAHKTNTKEDFERAMKDGANFLEGDLRTEINKPHAVEMRHDKAHESGDNLKFDEWLALGKASGRGLKLDVKEPDRMADILAAVEKAKIPEGRLMFNLGDGAMAEWGAEIRKRFPDAILAINPPGRLGGHKNSEGPLQSWQIERMIDLAAKFGPPASFVVRQDLLTNEAIAQLQGKGAISVWNSPSSSGVDDVAGLTLELRERGVDGVIDLRKSYGLMDKAKSWIDIGKNQVKTILGKIF